MGGTAWYLFKGDQPVGPYTLEHLKSLRMAGTLPSDGYAWREGFKDWQLVGDIAELTTPPPPPPQEPRDSPKTLQQSDTSKRRKRYRSTAGHILGFFLALPFVVLGAFGTKNMLMPSAFYGTFGSTWENVIAMFVLALFAYALGIFVGLGLTGFFRGVGLLGTWLWKSKPLHIGIVGLWIGLLAAVYVVWVLI